MASNYSQGYFAPENPSKYIGSNRPKYRSGWELTVMRFCDNHPAVIAWASESLRVPYRNPFTGKETFYVPDFLITYQDKNGNKISEVIEVKPRGQAVLELAKTQQEKAAVILNMAKWEACKAWCQRHGMKFRILTEEDIYNNWGAKSKPKTTRARRR
jgi:hypothetical protein